MGKHSEVSPVDVKLPDGQLQRLDLALANGRAANRSDAFRMGLDRLLAEWDRASWTERWEKAIPTGEDEFADLDGSGDR